MQDKLVVHIENKNSLAPDHPEDVSTNTALLLDVFSEMDASGVRYCVLRNFEELPDKAYGDVDILLGKGDLATVERILTRSLAGNLFLFKRLEKNGHSIFDISSRMETIAAIQESRPARVLRLDFVPELAWKGVTYLNTDDVLSSRQRVRSFYVAAAPHRAVHLLYHALLDKNFFNDRYRELLNEYVADDGDRIVEHLKPFVGSAMAQRLYSGLKTNDYAELLRLRGSVIVRLLLNRPTSLLSLSYFYVKKGARLAQIIWTPPGVLVATAGPDGAGKSTLLQEIGDVLAEAFEPVKKQYMGWKEFILPTKKLLNYIQSMMTRSKKAGADANGLRTTKVAAKDLERLPWTHNFSVLHYYIDLWARYLLKIRPVLVRGGLVLCDRYFYDVLARDVWICRNPRARAFLLAITPPPTLAVLFTGDPEAIANRKKEISSQETARQLAAYAVLKESGRTTLELNATNQLNENVLTSLRAIF